MNLCHRMLRRCQRAYIRHDDLTESITSIQVLDGVSAEDAVGADGEYLGSTVFFDCRCSFAEGPGRVTHLPVQPIVDVGLVYWKTNVVDKYRHLPPYLPYEYLHTISAVAKIAAHN